MLTLRLNNYFYGVEQELIEFDIYGLSLQEPIALITNWMMSFFCLYAYFKVKNTTSLEVIWWKRFFIVFSISTFLAGLGHVFFKYFNVPGKFPNWITSVLAGYFVGKAIIYHITNKFKSKFLELFLISKGIILLVLSVISQKFIFIAIDAIITYVVFCGLIAYQLYKKGVYEMKFMYYGVLTCIPAIFIFLFKININKWLNKDDLSHLLMLTCIIFFYVGAKKRMMAIS